MVTNSGIHVLELFNVVYTDLTKLSTNCLFKWKVYTDAAGINYLYHDCPPVRNSKVSEYDQEIPQSQPADNPMTPQGRATQLSRDTRKTNQTNNQLSLPYQYGCKTRMDIK